MARLFFSAAIFLPWFYRLSSCLVLIYYSPWQGKHKTASLSLAGRFDPDAALVDGDDLFHQRQPQATAVTARMKLGEKIKNALAVFSCNTHPVVPDIKNDILCLRHCTDFDLWLILIVPVLDGVFNQILPDLPEMQRIAMQLLG